MQRGLALLARSLELLEQLARDCDSARYEDALNSTTFVGSTDRAQTLNFDRLRAFAALGNRIELELRQGEWETRILSSSATAFDVSAQGPWEDGFSNRVSIQDAQIAAENNDAAALLHAAAAIRANVRLTIVNDPASDDLHWLRTEDAFHTLITRDSWFGFFSLLYSGDRPTRLVLHDAGSSSIGAGGLVVHGPDAFPDLPVWSLTEEAAAYRRAWLRGGREKAPPPTWAAPTTVEGLDRVASTLQETTQLLCWLWLATDVSLAAPTIRAHFEGMRPVDIDLQIGDSSDSLEAVTLWEWSIATTDPARREAIQQAVSLSIRDERDLPKGFKAVLRTARYLLRISQQGIIAEALATRRTAREAAFTVARDSAEAARSALRKTFDRILLQLGATAGILLANSEALIDQGATTALLVAILILIVFTALGAFIIDYPSVGKSLEAFSEDLDHYRDALPDEDLSDIRNMASLADARSQMQRTRIATGIILVTAAIAVLFSLTTVAESNLLPPAPSPSTDSSD